MRLKKPKKLKGLVAQVPPLRGGERRQIDSSRLAPTLSLVFSQTYLCMVRAAHPRIGSAISIKAFREARHAVVAAQGTGHGIVEAVFERAGIEPDVRVRLPHFLSVPMVIAETDLIVTVPERLGEAFAKILPVRLLPHPLKIPSFQVNQYWHRRFHQDPANQWLRGNFAKLFKQ